METQTPMSEMSPPPPREFLYALSGLLRVTELSGSYRQLSRDDDTSNLSD